MGSEGAAGLDIIENALDTAALRDRMSATERNVAAIQESVENLAASVDRTLKGVDRLREQRTADARPQYGAMTAIGGLAATVVLAIVGIAGNGYVRDQTRIESNLNALTSATNVARIAQLEWEKRHDWEVRDTNARQSAEIEHARELIEMLHNGVVSK